MRNDTLKRSYNIMDIEFQHQFKFADRHNLVWGAGYRHIADDIENKDITFYSEQKKSNLFSAFIHDEIEIIPEQWLLTLGSKIEHNGMTGFEYQPNIRLSWLINENQTLWSAISRAVRTPSRIEQGAESTIAFLTTTNQPIIGHFSSSSSVDSEHLLAYELGYRNQFTSKASVDIAFFYQKGTHLISVEEMEFVFIPIFKADNELTGNQYGIEVSVDWKVNSWWKVKSNYSYTKSSIYRDGDEVFGYNDSSGSVPEHQFSLRSMMDIRHDLQLDLWAEYIDKLEGGGLIAYTSGLVIDPYTRLTIRLAWKPSKNIELSLVGQNLLDSKHLEFTGEAYARPTEVERSIYAQMRWSFD